MIVVVAEDAVVTVVVAAGEVAVLLVHPVLTARARRSVATTIKITPLLFIRIY
jgi:hypothetical protein